MVLLSKHLGRRRPAQAAQATSLVGWLAGAPAGCGSGGWRQAAPSGNRRGRCAGWRQARAPPCSWLSGDLPIHATGHYHLLPGALPAQGAGRQVVPGSAAPEHVGFFGCECRALPFNGTCRLAASRTRPAGLRYSCCRRHVPLGALAAARKEWAGSRTMLPAERPRVGLRRQPLPRLPHPPIDPIVRHPSPEPAPAHLGPPNRRQFAVPACRRRRLPRRALTVRALGRRRIGPG